MAQLEPPLDAKASPESKDSYVSPGGIGLCASAR